MSSDQMPAVSNMPSSASSDSGVRSSFSSGLKKFGTGLRNNLDLILPALFSGGAGLGVLPGLMAGMSGRGLANVQRAKIDQDAKEQASRESLAREKMKQDAEEGEKNRKNRINVASVTHGDSGEKITDAQFLDAQKQIQALRNKGLSDDTIKNNYPDLVNIVNLYQGLHQGINEDDQEAF